MWAVGLAIEERKVDDKGRVYVSRTLRGRRIYMARLGELIVMGGSKKAVEDAVKLLESARKDIVDEYVRLLEELGEPSVEDFEETVREAVWERLRRAT